MNGRIRIIWRIVLTTFFVLMLALRWCATAAKSQQAPLLFTATGSIHSLAFGSKGELWAATAGGVLRWNKETAVPRLWTTADGLPSNDVRSVDVLTDSAGEDSARVEFLTGSAKIVKGMVITTGVVPKKKIELPLLLGGGHVAIARDERTNQSVAFNDLGLFYQTKQGKWQEIGLPVLASGGIVTGLSADDSGSSDTMSSFWVTFYADGAWHLIFDRSHQPHWEPIKNFPPDCRFATAIAASQSRLIVGTADDGVWERRGKERGGKEWTHRQIPGVLPSADIYGLAEYRGKIWASTFDFGFIRVDQANGTIRAVSFTNWNDPKLTRYVPISPRQLMVFQNRLLVLSAEHRVVGYDGRNWQPAWEVNTLSRPDVYCLAVTPSGSLLVGGWGGWAIWDGATWKQHWGDPELAGEPITAIAADANGAVWIGTQRRGLLRYAGETYTAYQEAAGLTDAWITCIGISNSGRLLIGTYSGGLLELVQNRLATRFRAEKYAIRAVVFPGGGETAAVATPVGVYREGASGSWGKIEGRKTGGLETQALLPTPDGLWVGSRCGLAFVPSREMSMPEVAVTAR